MLNLTRIVPYPHGGLCGHIVADLDAQVFLLDGIGRVADYFNH